MIAAPFAASFFAAFRDSLARDVANALARRVLVSASEPGAHCPLGCRPNALNRLDVLTPVCGEPIEARIAFATAFDGLGVNPEYEGAFAELGREYRARFP